MDASEVVNAKRVLTLAITIPSSAAPVTIWSLVSTAMGALNVPATAVRFWSIRGVVTAGTDRGAFLLGHSASAMLSYYAAAANCDQSATDLASNYVSAVDTTPVPAVIEVNVGV
jgi:hypothetical protein